MRDIDDDLHQPESALASRKGGWWATASESRLLRHATMSTISCRHATSLETLKQMVASGQGCALVPALAVAEVEGSNTCRFHPRCSRGASDWHGGEASQDVAVRRARYPCRYRTAPCTLTDDLVWWYTLR